FNDWFQRCLKRPPLAGPLVLDPVPIDPLNRGDSLRARAVIEWGLRRTCPLIDARACGIYQRAGSCRVSAERSASRTLGNR
ncbi:MAG TPA: hypothetical protein VN856_23550, partial [Mycobacterium sp.]|nr:hypothetical protein [Mycobacterium sp.]